MNRIVTREDWYREHSAFLEEEKEMMRTVDAFNRRRRALPWVRIEKDYSFVGEAGKVSLADLFASRSQLVIYHFMFGADWEEGCPSCSLWSDQFQGTLPHLAARDVTVAAVSTADYPRLSRYRERMGWSHSWYSAAGSDFNRDFLVSYSASEIERGETFYNYRKGHQSGQESPGLSVFCRDAKGEIFHTYSCYGRGLEGASLIYPILDRVPKGRDEEGLPWPMAWVRRRDEYGVMK
jgi:predicted dithiol-disulfide oxidoreductase (DUF899 family)